MPTLVQEDYFVCTDFDRNNNKFWRIQLFDDGTLTTIWGRVGITEQSKTWSGCTRTDYDKKIAAKLKVTKGRDAYTKVDIITSTSTSQTVVPSNSLEAIAARDVDVDSETTRDLIRWLSKVNVHNIVNSTTMTYNEAEGVFRTPLGVVGQTMVDRARLIITEITPYVEMNRYTDPGLKKLATEYLRIIPQDLGAANRKIRVDSIFTSEYLKKQSDILDALDASIASILTTTETGSKVKEEKTDRVFNLKLHQCNDTTQRDAVWKLFEGTRKAEHYHVKDYKFTNLYSIEKPDMVAAWEKDGAKLSNRMRLWHGTSYANVLSILKQGLVMPKYGGGLMFGPGIYFSDQSTKSLQYASGFWSGKSEGQRIFMFLSDVGMGNYHTPSRSTSSRPPAGHDSYFAKSGVSGVANNEMIIFRVSQCNLVYLVEFTR